MTGIGRQSRSRARRANLVERHDEVIGPHVDVALAERPHPGIEIAIVGDVDAQGRRLAAHERARRLQSAAGRVVGEQAMQDRRVRSVDAALERLQVVAFLDDLGDVTSRFRHLGPGELRQRRHFIRRPEISPDDAAELAGRIRGQPHLVLELEFLRLVQLIDAGTGHVELPAVIDAAQPAFLVAPEKERHAAMRAILLDEADAPLGVAEGDEFLAHQLYAHGRAVRFGDLVRQAGGDPIAPHRIAHRRAGADAGDQFVFFRWQHRRIPPRSERVFAKQSTPNRR